MQIDSLPAESPDTSVYDRLMGSLDRGHASLPLFLHCLTEQVPARRLPAAGFQSSPLEAKILFSTAFFFLTSALARVFSIQERIFNMKTMSCDSATGIS